MEPVRFPRFDCENRKLKAAFRIALGDLYGNIVPFEDGLLQEPLPCILAGLDYVTPWTRDAAINSWNAGSLLCPDIARNTLLSVLLEDPERGLRIGGEYWDAILWSVGAQDLFLATGDKAFLALAREAVRNSLLYFEEREFDPERGLFRGAACYGDGVSAYPDLYANHGLSGIAEWVVANPSLAAPKGFGLPIFALSTNLLYFKAYGVVREMEAGLGLEPDPRWEERESALRAAIDRHFFDPTRGTYRYLAGAVGPSEAQEGLGISFALLFGHAEGERAKSVLDRAFVSKHGIPCVHPVFPRYEGRWNPEREGGAALPGAAGSEGGPRRKSYGRHSGTVWPHVQGFFAEAALRAGRLDLFRSEMENLGTLAHRDSQFTEIYHPDTGEIYGGWQEQNGKGIGLWASARRQTWSATAFLRMVLRGLFGLSPRLLKEGHPALVLAPSLPEGFGPIHLAGLHFGEARVEVRVEGEGRKVLECRCNGEKVAAEAVVDGSRAEDFSFTLRVGA